MAEDIIDSIMRTSPAVGKLLEDKNSYEGIVDLIKDLLDQDLQLKELG